MKLAKYLADYLQYEFNEHNVPVFHEDYLQQFIQQGIEVFELTEGVKVLVVPEEIATPIEIMIQDAENSK